MTTWLNKAKSLLIAFLATHDHKYLITHDGKKLIAFDRSWLGSVKAATAWSGGSQASTAWTNRTLS